MAALGSILRTLSIAGLLSIGVGLSTADAAVAAPRVATTLVGPAPAEPAPAEPPPAATTVATAPESAAPESDAAKPVAEPVADKPAEPASAKPSAKPADDHSGWGASAFDDDDDDDDDHALDDDELGDGAASQDPVMGITPDEQLVTVPGGEVTLEPPVLVGPSGNPRHKWVYSVLFALRYNPLGATIDFKTGHRMQLIDKDSVLFRESYMLTGLRVFTTPAYTRLGPHIEFQPLALLNIYAGYNFVGYYSTFDLIQSFPSATSDYSDTALNARGEADDNYPTFGQIADISALLQAKVGPIAIRNNVVFYWAKMNLRNGDRVWYDQFMDIAFPRQGWGVTNDADAIYLFPDSGLKLGVRYSLAHVFYDADNFLPGEPVTRPNGPHHRVGPALLYTFFDRANQRLNKPTLVLLSQWFVQHRFRTGSDSSQAVPQITLAFTFQGDLLPHPQRRRIDRTGKKRRARQDTFGPTDVPASTEDAR